MRSANGRERAGSEAGLTLADLSITLGAFAVLLLALVPVLSKLLDAYHLRGAAHQMFAELQRARLSAIMQNNRYRLTVVGGSPVYVIHDDNNNDDVDNDGTDSVQTRSLANDSPGISLVADNDITFAPNGTALTLGQIIVTNQSGATRTIAVGAGGRIRLQ
jgi:Tfp pilus assembly protein FimT